MVRTITLICGGSGIIALILSAFTFMMKPKIGYVNNSIVLSEYYAVKESEGILEGKIKELEDEQLRLEKDIDASIKAYQINYPGLDKIARIKEETRIKQLQQGYFKLKEENEQKIQEEDQKLTAAVLVKINSFMENYGKENGFDVIIGVTEMGNVLYANEAMDITDLIVKEINIEYQGGK